MQQYNTFSPNYSRDSTQRADKHDGIDIGISIKVKALEAEPFEGNDRVGQII